jgi:cyclic-di-AMP phosphodiesterase PgpH
VIARRSSRLLAFTRRDAVRLVVAATLLIAAIAALLAIDILPTGFRGAIGELADRDIRAPRSLDYVSDIETQRRRDEAVAQVPPQYDYTVESGQAAAQRQTLAFETQMRPVDAAFGAVLADEARQTAIASALPDLSPAGLATVQELDPGDWTLLRREMGRVLGTTQRGEVKDTQLLEVRASLADRFSSSVPEAQRKVGAEILGPLIVANSTYDEQITQQVRDEAAAGIEPVRLSVKEGEIVAQQGQLIDATLHERLALLNLLDPHPDLAKLVGWLMLATLLVGLLLGWVWRFRSDYWHRNSALLLLALVLLVATLLLRVTADRSLLPYLVPTAAAGLLLAVLLDTGTALMMMALIGVLAGAITGLTELGAYIFLGGLTGIVVIRRGERVGQFVQAAVAMAIVNIAVVTTFTLLGDRDVTGVIQLVGAASTSALGGAVAAAGTFALLGNVFGITTSYQLLELANPSQPLLRRLLLETPGTYHHSLMVGNLGERAAEAIGADPLLTRVAAYYHDVGKLANPMAFIENQAGVLNLHDDLTPAESAAVLAAHVANGIDLAYRYKLPRPLIAFIPQHHGTGLMSYFYAKARDEAVEAAGIRPGSAGAEAAMDTVDRSLFRHAGPRPQSREAAILMLADSVEASVRSLSSQEEPAIRAMVDRIISERQDDGQLDECDLTLRDLDRIREAFVAQLLGMYHRRIEYPQNKVVELESRRAAGGRGS